MIWKLGQTSQISTQIQKAMVILYQLPRPGWLWSLTTSFTLKSIMKNTDRFLSESMYIVHVCWINVFRTKSKKGIKMSKQSLNVAKILKRIQISNLFLFPTSFQIYKLKPETYSIFSTSKHINDLPFSLNERLVISIFCLCTFKGFLCAFRKNCT